jgi:hypothetical protein
VTPYESRRPASGSGSRSFTDASHPGGGVPRACARRHPASVSCQVAHSSPYYSPGMADVVMGNLHTWSKSAYPALSAYPVVMLTAPLAMMGADLPILARGATFLQIESPSIVPIGQYVPYTSIPNGFYMQAGGRWFNVIPSGAKHLVEYGARYAEFAEPIREMNMAYKMTSFQAALSELSASGYTYGTMYEVGGWEFGVSAAQKGSMDVLFHALPLF